MTDAKRLKIFYPVAALMACCVLFAGCMKPDDVNCVDLSEQAWGETIICADGNEPQVCMAPESDHCGFYVNSRYIPCKSCYDCDAAVDLTVALCQGR